MRDTAFSDLGLDRIGVAINRVQTDTLIRRLLPRMIYRYRSRRNQSKGRRIVARSMVTNNRTKRRINLDRFDNSNGVIKTGQNQRGHYDDNGSYDYTRRTRADLTGRQMRHYRGSSDRIKDAQGSRERRITRRRNGQRRSVQKLSIHGQLNRRACHSFVNSSVKRMTNMTAGSRSSRTDEDRHTRRLVTCGLRQVGPDSAAKGRINR